MLDQFINEGLRGKSEATVKTYRHALQQFSQWLDGCGTTLEHFSRTDVQQYVTYMASKKRPPLPLTRSITPLRSSVGGLRSWIALRRFLSSKPPTTSKPPRKP